MSATLACVGTFASRLFAACGGIKVGWLVSSFLAITFCLLPLTLPSAAQTTPELLVSIPGNKLIADQALAERKYSDWGSAVNLGCGTINSAANDFGPAISKDAASGLSNLMARS